MSDRNGKKASTVSRRVFLQRAGALGLAATPLASLAAGVEEDVPFADGPRELVTYPQKRPLIRVHTRPPHLETPFEVFNGGAITPNDAFFVRYHLANIPLSIDPETYRLEVTGSVSRTLSLSISDLKKIRHHDADAVTSYCVNQL